MINQRITNIKNWCEKYEKKLATFSLLFGFIFDSLTLQRIDALRENLWIALNLLIVAVCIIVLNRQEDDGIQEEETVKHFWLFNLLQFSFGSILGAFFIFYFQSATLSVSWPFLLILLALMVGNELFQKRYARLVLQVSFFYLSLYFFAIFIIPILVHSLNSWVFLLSGIASLGAVWMFLKVLRVFARARFREGRQLIVRSIITIFVCVNILYFTNLIPPIPLSLKDAGIYHSLSKNSDGTYTVREEASSGFLRFFKYRKDVHVVAGQPLYAYSAIFSPASLNTTVVHEWEHYDERVGEWVSSSKIPLHLSGGRSEGFRTFSAKANLAAGNWRVNVATPRGQFIGRINFEIIPATSAPSFKIRTKE